MEAVMLVKVYLKSYLMHTTLYDRMKPKLIGV